MKLSRRGTLTGAVLVVLAGCSPAVAQTDDVPPRRVMPVEGVVPDPSDLTAGETGDPSLGSPEFSDPDAEPCGTRPARGAACCPPPVWYVGAQALFLNRTRNREIKIVEDQDQSPAPPRGQRDALMTTNALDFDYQWGPQLTLGRRLGGGRRLEVTYFGTHHWNANATLQSNIVPADLSLPFDSNYTSDFDGAERVDVSYSSELHNVEANLLLNRCRLITPLIGVRYMNLNEGFDFQAAESNGDTSNYLIDTRNNLVGFQLGALLERQNSTCFRWSGGIKAGVYGNIAQQRTWVGDDNNSIVLRNFTNSENDVALIGELDLGCVYQVNRRLGVNAGYRVMWVEGVALAPDQLDYTTTATSGSGLNDNGGIFYDGGYVGLTYAF